MWKFLQKQTLIVRGDRVAVAVSGGRDSVTLLAALRECRAELGIELSCVHVCHHLRPHAAADAGAVEALCAEWDVPFYRYDVRARSFARKNGLSLEAAARKLRYERFDAHLKAGLADKIAVAHTADDAAETALFNLVRGAGTGGWCAMRDVLPLAHGVVVRPFLEIFRSQVAAYWQEHRLPVWEDETNSDLAFSRNRIRSQALPALEQAHPGATGNILAFSRRMRELDDYLGETVDLFEEDGCISLMTPPALRYYAVRRVLRRLDGAADLSERCAKAVSRLFDDPVTGRRVQLPHGAVAVVTHCAGREIAGRVRCVRVYRPTTRTDFERPFEPGREETVVTKRYRIAVRYGEPSAALYGAAERIPAGSVFRYPRPGDTFRKFGGGTKKLCDWFTDRKIPREERDTVPVLACGSRILAVLPYAVSEDLRVAAGDAVVNFDTKKRTAK